LKYSTIWDGKIALEEFKYQKISTILDFDENNLKINFSQNYVASQYAFKYYFNLYFEKL
jgi:hypothetical protein